MRLLGFTCTGLGTLLAARLLGGWALALAAGTPSRVEDAVALLGTSLGAAVALWYALTALVLLLAELAASSRRLLGLAGVLRRVVGRLGAPALRRAAVVGLGASLTFGAAPALATGEVPDDLRPGVSSSLQPAPAPTGADGPATAAPSAPTNPTAPSETIPSEGPSGSTPTSTPSTTATARPSPSTTQPPSDSDPVDTPAAPGGTDSADRAGTSADAMDAPPPRFRTVGRVEPGTTDGAAARPATGTAGGGESPATAGSGSETTAASPAHRTYVVQEGDTLWQIAQAHLGADARDAAVAREWPRWHATNLAVIGDDPDLIHPGQTLLVPDSKDS